MRVNQCLVSLPAEGGRPCYEVQRLTDDQARRRLINKKVALREVPAKQNTDHCNRKMTDNETAENKDGVNKKKDVAEGSENYKSENTKDTRTTDDSKADHRDTKNKQKKDAGVSERKKSGQKGGSKKVTVCENVTQRRDSETEGVVSKLKTMSCDTQENSLKLSPKKPDQQSDSLSGEENPEEWTVQTSKKNKRKHREDS